VNVHMPSADTAVVTSVPVHEVVGARCVTGDCWQSKVGASPHGQLLSFDDISGSESDPGVAINQAPSTKPSPALPPSAGSATVDMPSAPATTSSAGVVTEPSAAVVDASTSVPTPASASALALTTATPTPHRRRHHNHHRAHVISVATQRTPLLEDARWQAPQVDMQQLLMSADDRGAYERQAGAFITQDAVVMLCRWSTCGAQTSRCALG
jgi:hypothetical protein